jgi:hypothetical protein
MEDLSSPSIKFKREIIFHFRGLSFRRINVRYLKAGNINTAVRTSFIHSFIRSFIFRVAPSVRTSFHVSLPILQTVGRTIFGDAVNRNCIVRMVLIPGHYKKKVVGLERGPLSLVSTIEELLDRKVAAPV